MEVTESEAYENLPLPAVIEDEAGGTITHPTPAQLSEVVELTQPSAPSANKWVTCRPLPDRPGRFIRARRLAGGYQLEASLDTGTTAVELPIGDEVTVAFLAQIRDWAPPAQRASIPVIAAPRTPVDPETLEYAEEVAAVMTIGGFHDFLEIVENIVELADRDAPITEVEAQRVLWPIWQGRLAEQAGWPERTDNDRLDSAFAELAAAGITARQHFTCCQSCGISEIAGVEEGARGYAFYHEQDTEAAVAGDGLSLAFGSLDGSASAAIGQEVVAALTRAGLPVEWNGEDTERILVRLQWRQRLPV